MSRLAINQRLTPLEDQTSSALTDDSGGTASATLPVIADSNTADAVAGLAAQVNALVADIAALQAQNAI